MSKIDVQNLSNVSKTLLAALCNRATESQRPDALVKDDKAVEIMNRLDYDFSQFRGKGSGPIFSVLRARQFDRYTRAFLTEHPGGVVVDIGCGLDTRFNRVDNGTVRWYDLDLPEVITLRRKFLEETPRCRFIASSALDFSWMNEIRDWEGQAILFLAEGIFPYLEEHDIRCLVLALLEHFGSSELIFDALPPLFVKFSSLHPALRTTQARLHWSLNDSREVERWHSGIQLLSEWHYFDESEPRLGLYRLMRWFSPISNTKIVRYKLAPAQSI